MSDTPRTDNLRKKIARKKYANVGRALAGLLAAHEGLERELAATSADAGGASVQNAEGMINAEAQGDQDAFARARYVAEATAAGAEPNPNYPRPSATLTPMPKSKFRTSNKDNWITRK